MDDHPDGPGRAAAFRFAAVFLAAFLLCGLLGLEAWPLTGWRLFADERHAVQPGWQAVTVDDAGREEPIPFAELPAGFRGNVQVLNGFAGLPEGGRAAVCRAWAGAVRERGAEVAAIRVYRTVTDVSQRVGERAAPPRRQLRHTCALGGGGDAAP